MIETLGIDEVIGESGSFGHEVASTRRHGGGASRSQAAAFRESPQEPSPPIASIPKRRYNPMDRMFPRRVTALRAGVKDKTRVNVYMGGKYAFSLALSQVVDNGIKVGRDLSEEDEARLRVESEFGKAYQRALEWVLTRPHSVKELDDYLYKKSRPGVRTSRDKLGNFVTREYDGMSPLVGARVKERLIEKGYINDEQFARYFIENRRLRKGVSRKRLLLELHAKGVRRDLAERVMGELAADGFGRDEKAEMQKIIEKKLSRHTGETTSAAAKAKLVKYLVRQGFNYSDAREAVAATADLA
ncbi:RecX family transcriptional regulator [Candidatus Saccharibacteria bacterium]|nr:RecX family transcriptional regulator [Candidatus Saccharibacteria bacterium]